MVSSGVFQSGFRPLFVRRLPQLWEKKQEKTGKERREGRKRGRGTRERDSKIARRDLQRLSTMVRIRVCFSGAAGLSGPQWFLQLEYFFECLSL